ncbi:hypothetical protein HF086_012058 [Spodoptera exigua]|uniref:Uncharacterized protein n=1 Tax=Spodoptera exigua TaxID=7107 RepID=A0A922SH46_SPOEX|nr:hypothetical protein HF086_012058 [Spodoptera exigua]
MKITVQLFVFCVFALALANSDDPTQLEKYDRKIKTYQLEVPGKDPITIIEKAQDSTNPDDKWEDVNFERKDNDDAEIKNLMTHIVHDFDENRPRCYGPSCQDGFNSEEEDALDDYILTAEKLKDYGDLPQDRLQAISALAAKLKKDKMKADRFSSMNSDKNEDDGNGKVYTTWNRLKVKQHKHPFDDKDGWVTLEPVAWSTSKISKWKPNIKKQKPSHWNDDENRFPSNDRFPSDDRFHNDDRFSNDDDRFPSDDRFHNDDRFTSSQDSGSNYNYMPHKKPSSSRPSYMNNKLHLPPDFEQEIPSKPSWTKPQQASYPSSWAPDEGRRPHKPNCDKHENYSDDDSVYYGMSDSVVTDQRPVNFPYEYEALHQSLSSSQKRPFRRPTQVVYAGGPEYENDRVSRPPHGDGQWVLLSTTKGYRNKKRQRSLNPPADDRADVSTMTSHQAVALTVLPVDKARTNMTTSHGGMLEVEKSFQTVEESKRDMDKKNDLEVATTQFRPVVNKNRLVKRKIVSNVSPDSSTLLAAVGAGMVPATMAMVVPMMLGKRRRREINRTPADSQLDSLLLYKYR